MHFKGQESQVANVHENQPRVYSSCTNEYV